MKNKLLELTKKLMVIESDKEHLGNLELILEVCKYELDGFKFDQFNSNDIPSLIYFSGEKRPDRFKILLNAHLDVVPGKQFQFEPYEKGGKLYGRGSYDMKAAAAASILVFKELADKVDYPLGLQLVTDEEVGSHNGTGHQIQNGVTADFVIVGETSSNFNIKYGAKGVLWLKVRSRGVSAHGAYADRGKNAIWKMNEFLNKLNKVYPEPTIDEWKTGEWNTTVNLAVIATTNETYNKVPDECEIGLDVRYTFEDKDIILDKIKDLLLDDMELEILGNDSPQHTDPESPYIKTLQEVVGEITDYECKPVRRAGGSDIRFFTHAGGEGIEFGPIGEGHHTENEWVDIESVVKYYEVLKEYLQRF